MSEPLVLRWAVRVVQVGGMVGSFTVRVSWAFANVVAKSTKAIAKMGRRCMQSNLPPSILCSCRKAVVPAA